MLHARDRRVLERALATHLRAGETLENLALKFASRGNMRAAAMASENAARADAFAAAVLVRLRPKADGGEEGLL
jgi:hypothetical protein